MFGVVAFCFAIGRIPARGRKDDDMTKKFILALVAGSIALSASACNTVRGAGQDLESAANEVDSEI